MTSYRVISAADWGGTWSRPPQYEKPLDPYGVLHHTAGSPYSSMTAEQAFHRLNESVKSGKGYSFLDYDMLCHYEKARDLVTIGWGRGKWMSAATRNFNEQGEAVCWLGYFHPGSRWSETVQPYHIEGAARAFNELRKANLVRDNATIIGHRQNPAHPNATACPGNYWYPSPLNAVIARYNQLRGNSGTIDLSEVDKLVKEIIARKHGQGWALLDYLVNKRGLNQSQVEAILAEVENRGGINPPPPPPPPTIEFDPASSRYALWPLGQNKPKLVWEDEGDAVRYLTGVMRNQVGLSVKITGYYDSEVANAVRLVQSYNGLPMTGWVPSMSDDPRFWQAIDTYASK